MKNKNIKISIIGSGIVGQATGKGFAAKGFDITFIDVNPRIIEVLKDEGYEAYLANNANAALDCDISIFTVPTPTIGGEIKLDYLKQAAKDLGKRIANMKKYHLAVVRSTVVPGTTEGVVLKQIEKYSGKKAGKDFGVCMNPEYLRELTSVQDFANPWIIVFGEYDKRSGDLLEKVYQTFSAPIYRISIKEAEMQKYVHNLYNAVKITFFNEMRKIGKNLKIDTDRMFELTVKSCEAMWNAKYGIRDFGAFSGACLPKDTQAFYDWVQKKGWSADLLGSAIEVNKTFINTNRKSGLSERPEVFALPL
jgi:UDPglucose 6-dehydrogenase